MKRFFDNFFGSFHYAAASFRQHTPNYRYLGHFLRIWKILVEKWISYENYKEKYHTFYLRTAIIIIYKSSIRL